MFSFPSSLLVCDYLSDSGSTSMTDLQWASLHLGDESYGRNAGYYCLLDALRDTFERGNNPKKLINLVLTGEDDPKKLSDAFIQEHEGGFVNGGIHQLSRPNAFITPQGRCAETLLFSTMKEVLAKRHPGKVFTIPSNGFFDTTEAHAHWNNFNPVNLFSDVLGEFDVEDVWTRNPFKGNIDIPRLRALIEEKGVENVPIILLTITNNTAAGQPVSMENIKQTAEIAKEFNIPLIFDACRFAENARFIQEFEEGFAERTIQSIIQEMFQYCEGFTISLKKDGMANIGGALCFRDKGLFQQQFSEPGRDVGVVLKEKQILTFGNDSYGGLSGRDIMALTVGFYEVVKKSYLKRRIDQVRVFAEKLARNGVPVVLPAGGHAIYVNIDKFFEGTEMTTGDFMGVGVSIELVRLYGIRSCELGPFAFEWDQKTEEQRKGILNLLRFAVPRNAYTPDHIDYTVAAVSELYKHRETIPKVIVSRGKELHLRHFQSGLTPIYPEQN
eukprot:TRINITY_DN8666_c0_g1_i1.p1 TRINITY_DN8666_c0_g1~~TRINITY_DN8666_c0_g1_i1.p1  ORF type:complete len:560 (+),score=196.83 TRINITY_DN8666_c0_g1_i1:184-1680(+)